MFYKRIASIFLILLVACSKSEQATDLKIEEVAENAAPISMEEARKIAEAVENEYYSDKLLRTKLLS